MRVLTISAGTSGLSGLNKQQPPLEGDTEMATNKGIRKFYIGYEEDEDEWSVFERDGGEHEHGQSYDITIASIKLKDDAKGLTILLNKLYENQKEAKDDY